MISPELIFDIGQTVISDKGQIAIREPQRSYMWECYVVDADRPRSGENVKFYMTSGFIPGDMSEPIKKRYMGQPFVKTGYSTAQNVFTATLWDDDTLFAYRYMQTWINQINDPVASRNAGSKAKRDLVLVTKNRYDSRATGTFIMNGSFPTELAAAPLNYSDSNNFTFDVSFTFDHKFMNNSAEEYRFSE